MSIRRDEINKRFEFRDIHSDEIEQVISIEQICFPPNEACSPKAMRERIAAAPELFLVAIDKKSDRVAGFFNGVSTMEEKFRDEFFTDIDLYECNGQSVMLLGLDVLPEYRGQGLAGEIVSRYIERETVRGRKQLFLTCLEAKVQMYEKMGFHNNGLANSTWGGEQWYEMEYVLQEQKKVIKKENVVPLYESRFLKVFDLQYEPGMHYYDATRRDKDHIVAVKSDEEFKAMLPDAVSCVLILNIKGEEPLLALTREYRFPTGQFILSVPAGLIDAQDADKNKSGESPVLIAAKREIFEETGIAVEETDTVQIINPLVFSTPGMTDESNALVRIILNRDIMPTMSQEGAVGGECFDGFALVNKEEARNILKKGVDEGGKFYSVYTWMALMCFVSDIF